MKHASKAEIEETVTIFQIFMVVLSLYIVISLLAQYMFTLSPQMDLMIQRIDFIVCIIFLGDFFYRFYQAPSKKRFMRWGWIDLVSSIPLLPATRTGKIIRAFKILRVLRGFKSIRILIHFLLKNRSKNTFVTVAAVSCLLVLAGSMTILKLEDTNPASNIKTPSDALWWAVVTITTVGYGDKYPVSDYGRIIAAVLMTAGVGLFGTFTGFVASMFVEPDIKREQNEIRLLIAEVRILRNELGTMDGKIQEMNLSLRKDRKRRRRKNRGSAEPGENQSKSGPV